MKRQTDLLFDVMRSSPIGIKKQDLIRTFYANYDGRSLAQKAALDVSFGKLIQRLRRKLVGSNNRVEFCVRSKLWRIEQQVDFANTSKTYDVNPR